MRPTFRISEVISFYIFASDKILNTPGLESRMRQILADLDSSLFYLICPSDLNTGLVERFDPAKVFVFHFFEDSYTNLIEKLVQLDLTNRRMISENSRASQIANDDASDG